MSVSAEPQGIAPALREQSTHPLAGASRPTASARHRSCELSACSARSPWSSAECMCLVRGTPRSAPGPPWANVPASPSMADACNSNPPARPIVPNPDLRGHFSMTVCLAMPAFACWCVGLWGSETKTPAHRPGLSSFASRAVRLPLPRSASVATSRGGRRSPR